MTRAWFEYVGDVRDCIIITAAATCHNHTEEPGIGWGGTKSPTIGYRTCGNSRRLENQQMLELRRYFCHLHVLPHLFISAMFRNGRRRGDRIVLISKPLSWASIYLPADRCYNCWTTLEVGNKGSHIAGLERLELKADANNAFKTSKGGFELINA